jgi:2-(1,2-epoxy-1,2-dihydrophenyl)acetyl-CoA isomerase
MSDSILLTREGGLARVTLNRPASLNAVNFEMGTRWRDIAREVTSDPSVGAVILDAAGRAFCGGGDVMTMATSSRRTRRSS